MSKNINAPDWPRRYSRRLLGTLLPLVGLLAVSCHSFGPTGGTTTIVVPLQPLQGGTFYNAQHQLLPVLSTFCTNLAWTTCNIPEMTDDQAFMGANQQTYGPYAYIAPAQNLASHDSDSDFEPLAVLVGFVFVEPNPMALPATYTDLRLSYGFNCMYLKHNGSLFRAYIVPQAGTCGSTGTYTPDDDDELNVLPIASTAFPGDTNVPPVARFHEGVKGQSAGVPFLGLKCGDKWCLILPQGQGQPVSELSPPHRGVHPDRRTWEIYGWNDSQQLALQNPAGGLMRSPMRASVVAVPNLGDLSEADFTEGFKHVATVYFPGGPVGKYDTQWRFMKHHNEIWLKRITDDNWTAEIRATKYLFGWIPIQWRTTQAYVDRHEHTGVIKRGTVRFLWTLTDEDLWIGCDDGCCRVAGQ